MLKTKKKGFSMVELTIILTLISILLLIAYSSFTGSKNDSTEANLKSSLDAVNAAQEVNYGNKHTFEITPTVLANLISSVDSSHTFTFTTSSLNIVNDKSSLSVAKSTDGSGTEIFGIAGTTGVECLLSPISIQSVGVTGGEKYSKLTSGDCSGAAAISQ